MKIKILNIIYLLLTCMLMACENPLGDGKAASSISDGFVPGLPAATYPHHLVLVSGGGQTGIVNQTIPVTVKSVDVAGIAVGYSNLTIQTLSGGGSVSAAATTDISGLATISWTLGSAAGSNVLRITGSNFFGSPSSLDISATALIGNLSAANSTITGTSGIVANGSSSSTVTITLRDTSGDPVGGLTPTFSATNTGSTNAYGACSVGSVLGVSTCTLTSTTAEVKTLSIATPVAKAGAATTFIHGPATKLVYTTEPAGAVQSVAFTTQPVIQIRDAYENIVNSGADATAAITLSLTTGTGTLGGTTSVAAIAGVVTFAGVSLDTAGSGRVLTATKASTLGSGGTAALTKTSASFTVNPPAPGAFAISSAVPAAGGDVTLTWAASTNATSYTVAYGTATTSYPTEFSTTATSPTTVTGLTSGNTYYFMVRAVNVTATTSGSPERSATSDSVVPTTPGSVAWASAQSSSLTATPAFTWTASTDAGSGLSAYRVALGTTAGGSDVVAWTSIGNVLTYTFTSLSLTTGTSYYASVRGVDTAGNLSVVATTAALPVDTAAFGAPTAVNDGVSTTSLTSSPTISWTASSSASDGNFSGYDIAIGTTAGATDISTWQSVGNVTSATLTSGFTMTNGLVYYATVRARRTTGFTSAAANGNGFTVVTDTPSISLNFLTGVKPLKVQFTRPGGANLQGGTYYNSSGLIAYPTYNLLLASQTLATTWSASAAVVTNAAAAAPDLTTTASFIREDNTTAEHSTSQTVAVTASTAYAFSIYAKSTDRFVRLKLANATDGDLRSTYFDLSNGTVAAGTGTIESVGTNWYRCTITATPTVATITATVQPTLASTGPSYAGNNTSGVYAWGAQLEPGTAATNYITTTTALAYAPRFDYDPTPASCPSNVCSLRGLLIEELKKNRLTYSEDASQWTTIAAPTINVNAAAAPDGNSTADRITDSDAAIYDGKKITTTITATSTYTASMFIKAGTSTTARLRLLYTGGATPVDTSISIDLTAGTIAASGSVVGSGIQQLTNSWYRVWITVTDNSPGNTSAELYPYVGNVATATGSILVWGAQLEAGFSPTSYIPTTTVELTRSADVAVVDDMSLVTTQGVIVAKGISGFLVNDSNSNLLCAMTSLEINASNRIQLRRTAGSSSGVDGKTSALYFVAGASAMSVGGGVASWPRLTTKTLAMSYKTNGFLAVADGTSLGSSVSGNVFTPTKLVLGNGTSLSYFNGWLRSVDLYAASMTIDALKVVGQ